MGQSIDKVPAGLATVEPSNTKSVPSVIVPPVLSTTSWLPKAPVAAEITINTTASATAIRRHPNPSVMIGRARATGTASTILRFFILNPHLRGTIGKSGPTNARKDHRSEEHTSE